MDGEVVRANGRQRSGQFVDGVVLDRARRVAAGIGGFELKVLHLLFARLNVVRQFLAILDPSTAAFVEGELSVDQVAVVLDQPIHAVRRAAFFVGGERHDDVAIRHELLGLEAHDEGEMDRTIIFVVADAATIEGGVLLNERVGRQRPVFRLGFYDVNVREQQHGLFAELLAAEAGNQVAFARRVGEDGDVGVRKASGFEVLGHGLSGGKRGAVALLRVDFDQLAKQIAGDGIPVGEHARLAGLRLERSGAYGTENQEERGEGEHEATNHGQGPGIECARNVAWQRARHKEVRRPAIRRNLRNPLPS